MICATDLSADEAAAETMAAARLPWQFRLWHLFALMSFVGCCAALARYRGPGTLMTTLGLGVAGLSYLSCWPRLQQGRPQRITLWIAWFTFLISLCLPTFRVFGTAYGWEAAWIVLVGPWERIFRGEFDLRMLLWLADCLANLLQVTLPLLIWRLSRERGQAISAVLLVVIVGPWLTIWTEMNMLVGYYVWCASFYLTLLALPMRRATLVSMVLFAIGLIVMIEVMG